MMEQYWGHQDVGLKLMRLRDTRLRRSNPLSPNKYMEQTTLAVRRGYVTGYHSCLGTLCMAHSHETS